MIEQVAESRQRFSWRDILNLGLRQCPLAEVSAQKGRSIEINFPARNLGEFTLKAEKLQARHEIGLEWSASTVENRRSSFAC